MKGRMPIPVMTKNKNTLHFPTLPWKHGAEGAFLGVAYWAAWCDIWRNIHSPAHPPQAWPRPCDVAQTNKNDTQLMKLDEYQPCDRRDSSDGSHFDRPDTRWQLGVWSRRSPTGSLPGYSGTPLTLIRCSGRTLVALTRGAKELRIHRMNDTQYQMFERCLNQSLSSCRYAWVVGKIQYAVISL